MQIDNTSISDSEICQTAEQMEKEIIKSQSNRKSNQHASSFKRKICQPREENQINSHQQKDLSPSEEKEQDSKDKKKKNCYFCKSKKHGDKICPDILEKNTRGKNVKVMVNLVFRRKNSE